MIMDVIDPTPSMVQFSRSSIQGIQCGFGTILINDQCVSETFAKQQGCEIIDGL